MKSKHGKQRLPVYDRPPSFLSEVTTTQSSNHNLTPRNHSVPNIPRRETAWQFPALSPRVVVGHNIHLFLSSAINFFRLQKLPRVFLSRASHSQTSTTLSLTDFAFYRSLDCWVAIWVRRSDNPSEIGPCNDFLEAAPAGGHDQILKNASPQPHCSEDFTSRGDINLDT
jgi:hypothetical protein